ncbi:HAD-IA family hydrolase [Secundilactobacillus kimchicus]|uniref:p-Ser-HPr phosphatase n=1 Tax=Secundilactobacillus kimchicus JCM 15530 TaxID=1302272 RepID=A0A0R1HV89_9LACO|nr:HAD-IA family hydrolase [Secundilactobacillus kimchicus]KRK49417.1 P-Ser-HPr phosphatase [Secundilactobacillus kimchicus JCM 15530]
MTIHTLIWDFDGTLFDTYPFMVAAFKQALNQLGIDDIEIDDQEIYETMRQHALGTALQQFSAEFGLSRDQLNDRYRQIEPTLIGEAKPFDGVSHLLNRHLANGGRHFLLTHRNQSALTLLADNGLATAFSGTVTGDSPYPRKPDPAALNALIETYAIDRTTAVMVGDRTLDIEAGHNAGIRGALFDPGRLINDKNSHPEFLATQMAELEAALFD